MTDSESQQQRQQRWVVDSIEEFIASIEVDGSSHMIQIPVGMLPVGTKQGDVLSVLVSTDAQATRDAMAHSAEQVRRASEASAKRDPGGDIQL